MLYEAPASLFVADFLGNSNLLDGKISRRRATVRRPQSPSGETIAPTRGGLKARPGDQVVVLIRPEDMRIAKRGKGSTGKMPTRAVVKDIGYHGDTFRLEVRSGATCSKSRSLARSARL